MKYLTIAVFLLISITVRGSVTVSPRSDDVTTLLPLYKSDNGVDPKPVDKIQSPFKKNNVNNSYIYLDDVIFALKNQDWTKEEEPCLNRTLVWLKNLQNFTLWAVWNFDSISSEPQGVLYGSRYQLGNFDECLKPPWYKNHPEIKSQYCLAEIVIRGTDPPTMKKVTNQYDPYQSALNLFQYKSSFLRTLDKLTWGVCVPDVCQHKSVEKLVEIMLSHSHLGAARMRAKISVTEECQKRDHPRPFDASFYAFVSLAVILVFISLVCTNLNHDRRYLDKNTLCEKFIDAFDIKLNAKILIDHKEQDLNILYGIKFITMAVIVISHQYGVMNSLAISDGIQIDENIQGLFGMFFLHNDLAVDTFFYLSGFLLATNMVKLKIIPNLFVVILSRYVRLIVVYAIVIFYTCAVYPYTGSGPLWNRAIEEDTVQCRRNWLWNILMVSNYVDSENTCLITSWYIPCDFHFFVVTLLLLWIYRKSACSGKLLFVIITIAAIITPGILNYINELPPIQLFTYEFLTNVRASKQFQLTYIKSHTRYAANLIGFFTGCMYIYCSSSERLKNIPQKWAITGACFGSLTMGLILFTGPYLLWREITVLESAAYAALNRPLFSCGVAVFVICCSLGNIPIMKAFLSWHPFVPLSRLSYGLYLTHTIFITRNVFVTRNPQHNDIMFIIICTAGMICQCLFVAFVIWLLAEAPANNLLKICLTRNASRSNRKGEQNGNIHDNLHTTATREVISSKI